MTQQFHSWYRTREVCLYIQKYMSKHVLSSTVFNRQKLKTVQASTSCSRIFYCNGNKPTTTAYNKFHNVILSEKYRHKGRHAVQVHGYKAVGLGLWVIKCLVS